MGTVQRTKQFRRIIINATYQVNAQAFCNIFYNYHFTNTTIRITIEYMIATLRNIIISIILTPAREYVVVRNKK